MSIRLPAAGLLLAAAITAFSCRENPAEAEPAPVLMAYLPTWSSGATLDWLQGPEAPALTHLAYAFVKPAGTAGGGVDLLLRYPEDGRDPNARADPLEAMIAYRARHPDTRLLFSIGGWGLSAAFPEIAATAGGRIAFAGRVVDLLRQHGFDGVDLDWEFPVEGGAPDMVHRPGDAANFTELVRTLREHLSAAGNEDGKDYLITVAVAGEPDAQRRRYEMQSLSRLADWLNLMSYDINGNWSGETVFPAPIDDTAFDPRNRHLSVREAARGLLALGVPPGKIVVGVTTAPLVFAGVEPGNDGFLQPFDPAAEGPDIDPMTRTDSEMASLGYRWIWDNSAQSGYYYQETGGIFYSVEVPASLRAKLAFAADFRGLMIWSLDRPSPGLRDFLATLSHPGATPSGTEKEQELLNESEP